jgi:hypothetical protein
MQLFSLVNALLCSEPSTKQRYLDIKRFYVQPLSQQLGPSPARTSNPLAITARCGPPRVISHSLLLLLSSSFSLHLDSFLVFGFWFLVFWFLVSFFFFFFFLLGCVLSRLLRKHSLPFRSFSSPPDF